MEPAQGGSYLKLKDYWFSLFGGRVQKISLHAGMTCPNRDGTLGTGGCSYCLNEAFTPSYCHEGLSIEEQIEAGYAFQRRRYPRAVGFLGYLQAYTNSYGPLDELVALYDRVLTHPRLTGLVIGTRPDCLEEPLLHWLQKRAKEKPVYIEIGIESFSDDILASMNRGHTYAQAREAVCRVARTGIPVGGHFLVGFPGERWESFFEKVDELNNLPLHSVKVHQLHVFEGTPLAEMYRNSPHKFRFPAKREYFEVAASWLSHLRPGFYIDRIFGDAPQKYIVNPSWAVRLDRLVREFEEFLSSNDLRQGCRFQTVTSLSR